MVCGVDYYLPENCRNQSSPLVLIQEPTSAGASSLVSKFSKLEISASVRHQLVNTMLSNFGGQVLSVRIYRVDVQFLDSIFVQRQLQSARTNVVGNDKGWLQD